MSLPNIGLGVNYKGLQANWAADAITMANSGVTLIRPNLASLPANWTPPGPITSGSYEFWRQCAIFFASKGFWVSWGPAALDGVGTGQLTATLYAQYHDSVVADAAYMQSIGAKIGAYEIGNELEPEVDGVTLTQAQLITNLGQLATDVKAVYKLSPIAYSLYDTAGTAYNNWISIGMGGLDYLGLHPYGAAINSSRGWVYNGFDALPKMMNAFGPSRLYTSEFGDDADDIALQLMTDSLQASSLRNCWNTTRALSFNRAILYTYVGYLNQDNQFAMYLTDLSYKTMWNGLTQNCGRYSNVTR